MDELRQTESDGSSLRHITAICIGPGILLHHYCTLSPLSLSLSSLSLFPLYLSLSLSSLSLSVLNQYRADGKVTPTTLVLICLAFLSFTTAVNSPQRPLFCVCFRNSSNHRPCCCSVGFEQNKQLSVTRL